MAISSGDSHPDLSAIVSFEIRETYIPHGKFELANQHLQSPSEFRKFCKQVREKGIIKSKMLIANDLRFDAGWIPKMASSPL